MERGKEGTAVEGDCKAREGYAESMPPPSPTCDTSESTNVVSRAAIIDDNWINTGPAWPTHGMYEPTGTKNPLALLRTAMDYRYSRGLWPTPHVVP